MEYVDPLKPEDRSERMRLVRATGNRSTEWKLRAALVQGGIRGWRMHVRELPGCPDFVFVRRRVAVFVDGCFWHRCAVCKRPMPKSRADYWRAKIFGNVERARTVNADLSRLGYKVIRIWEHALRTAEGSRVALDQIRVLVGLQSHETRADEGTRDRGKPLQGRRESASAPQVGLRGAQRSGVQARLPSPLSSKRAALGKPRILAAQAASNMRRKLQSPSLSTAQNRQSTAGSQTLDR